MGKTKTVWLLKEDTYIQATEEAEKDMSNWLCFISEASNLM